MFDSDTLARVAASGRITAEDVLALRRAIYGDTAVSAQDVEALFALDEATTEHDPSWCELFTEAVSDYLVHQVEPQGHISEANADWLVTRIARDGAVKTATELQLLVNVLEQAKASPDRLSAFALQQVKLAVVDGEGPLATGALEPGRVNRAEADLVRRILYAFGGDGCIVVTRAEAEVLFDINDATAASENDPAWSELFVKAIANFMMAASGYSVPSRQEALRREAWLDASTGGVPDFFSRIASGGLRGILNAYRQPETEAAWSERNASVAARSAEAEAVTAGEAEWLAGRIGRDGALHANEKALLRFIRDEAPSIHPSLQPLLAKAA